MYHKSSFFDHTILSLGKKLEESCDRANCEYIGFEWSVNWTTNPLYFSYNFNLAMYAPGAEKHVSNKHCNIFWHYSYNDYIFITGNISQNSHNSKPKLMALIRVPHFHSTPLITQNLLMNLISINSNFAITSKLSNYDLDFASKLRLQTNFK